MGSEVVVEEDGHDGSHQAEGVEGEVRVVYCFGHVDGDCWVHYDWAESDVVPFGRDFEVYQAGERFG